MPSTRNEVLRNRVGIHDRDAIVTPSKTGLGVLVRWAPVSSSPSSSRRRSKRLPLLNIQPNHPEPMSDLCGPQSPLTPLSDEEEMGWGEGLPALKKQLSTVVEDDDEVATQRSLSTLPTLTDTSFGSSQEPFGYRTPTPHRSISNNSALQTPRKGGNPLVRSSAITFWRQGLGGIAEADVYEDVRGALACVLSQEEADQASTCGGDSEREYKWRREYSPLDINEAAAETNLTAGLYAKLIEGKAPGRIMFDGNGKVEVRLQRKNDGAPAHHEDMGIEREATEPLSIDDEDSAMGDDTERVPPSRASPDDVNFELAIKGEEPEDPTKLLADNDFVYQRVRAYDPQGKPLVNPEDGKAIFVYVAKRLEAVKRPRDKFGAGGTLLTEPSYSPPDRSSSGPSSSGSDDEYMG